MDKAIELIQNKLLELYRAKCKDTRKGVVYRMTSAKISILEEMLEELKKEKNNDKADTSLR